MTFQSDQKSKQISYLERSEFLGKIDLPNKPYQFTKSYKKYNLAPNIRDQALAYFDHSDPTQKIAWHRHSGHACSSQACCVNFLFPLMRDEKRLTRWVEHLTGDIGLKMKVIESRHDRDELIAFEWFPETDYLNESVGGMRSRGANATSVDAALIYSYQDQVKLLLIEWKYIESYSHQRPLRTLSGDPTRLKRYHNLWKRPHGPLKQDLRFTLHDFFLEPWYQLLRQQMLAYHVETDPLSGIDKASVIHISPSSNKTLRKVQGKKFEDYAFTLVPAVSKDRFKVFQSMLATQWSDRFKSLSTRKAFACFTDHEGNFPWLRDRYPDLF